MSQRKRLPPREVVGSYLLSRQIQQRKDLRTGIRQEWREQLGRNSQGFQQIVQHRANPRQRSRILSQRKRRRFRDVFVGLVGGTKDCFQRPAEGQVGHVVFNLRRSLSKSRSQPLVNLRRGIAERLHYSFEITVLHRQGAVDQVTQIVRQIGIV